MRIIVIGYSGAGKTVLTEELAKHFKCPVIHIDDLLFTSTFESQDSIIAINSTEKILQKNSSWIMDGYKDTFTKSTWLKSADYIVFLNLNRATCFWRVLKRTFRRFLRDASRHHKQTSSEYSGTTKTKSTSTKQTRSIWTRTKIFKSFRWILLDERRLQGGRYYFDVGKVSPEKFIILRNQKEIDRFKHDIFFPV